MDFKKLVIMRVKIDNHSELSRNRWLKLRLFQGLVDAFGINVYAIDAHREIIAFKNRDKRQIPSSVLYIFLAHLLFDVNPMSLECRQHFSIPMYLTDIFKVVSHKR